MNSINFQKSAIYTPTSPEWEGDVETPAPSIASLLPRPVVDSGRNKQRALVVMMVAGVQALFIAGLLYGMTRKPTPLPKDTMMVQIFPEKEDDTPPPPPPPKPMMINPVVEMTLAPPPVQIYEPPPLLQVQAPPSPITATTAPPPVRDPKIAIEDFQHRLLRHVNENLRYPPRARALRQEGTVLVRFKMDRHGRIIAVAIEKPCSFQALNEEGVAVLTRAQPFPAPPPELTGDPIEMVLPVRFSLRDR